MILLVEDDAVIRTALAEHLRASGHEVLEAESAEKAMVWLSVAHPIRLVVVDFISSDVDGLEFIKSIRRVVPDMPLILMSGYLPEETGQAVLAQSGPVTKF